MSGGVPLIQNPSNIITTTGTTADQHLSNQAIKKNFDDLNANAVSTKELKDQLQDYKEIALLPTDINYTIVPTDLDRLFEVDLTDGPITFTMPTTGINSGFTFAVIDDKGNATGTNKLIMDGDGNNILITDDVGDPTEELSTPNFYRRYYWNGAVWRIIGKVN